MRERKQGKSDPKAEQELMIERGTMSAGVCGKPPGNDKRCGMQGRADRHAEGGHDLKIARSCAGIAVWFVWSVNPARLSGDSAIRKECES